MTTIISEIGKLLPSFDVNTSQISNATLWEQYFQIIYVSNRVTAAIFLNLNMKCINDYIVLTN